MQAPQLFTECSIERDLHSFLMRAIRLWMEKLNSLALSIPGIFSAIKQVFDERGDSKISSADLAGHTALSVATGTTWSPTPLATMLRPFGIRPKTVRIGGQTPKGYERRHFTDAWERYLAQGVPQGDDE
jgi:hypothetical protein